MAKFHKLLKLAMLWLTRRYDDNAPSLRAPLCDLLGCEVPILQAGMGGPARHELAAAVAQAGGFGMLGMVREAPELIAQGVTALRALTDRGFAVNDVLRRLVIASFGR